MNITLYTTHCPQCNILEKKLQASGIEYTTSEDVQKMLELGFKSAPVLVVDDKPPYSFKDACAWVDEYEYEEEEECASCKLT